MGGFRTWRRSAITELQRTKMKTKPGDQVGMEWSSIKTKFEMDDMEDPVGMVEDATTRGVGALENEIGLENVHHPTGIMGEGREQSEVFLMMHTNGQAAGGSDGVAHIMVLTYPDHVAIIHLSGCQALHSKSTIIQNEEFFSASNNGVLDGSSQVAFLTALFSLLEVCIILSCLMIHYTNSYCLGISA